MRSPAVFGSAAALLAPALAIAHELPAPHAHLESAPAFSLGDLATVLVVLVPITVRLRTLLLARTAAT